MNLRQIQHLLKEATGENTYFELLDYQGTVVFSNMQSGDLTPITQSFNVGGKPWKLTGYINNTHIHDNTVKMNRSVTIALLIAAAVIIPIALLLLSLAFRPHITLRQLITSRASGNGDLILRLKIESNDDLGQIADGINRFVESL